MDLYGELTWRGLVYDATDGAQEALSQGAIAAYIGFDPTAASLHVGSLLVMTALAHLQRCGHSPIALVGGGTGLIGDPSGKAIERKLLAPEQVAANVAGIREQLSRFLDFDCAVAPARLIDNAEWLTRLSAIEFMRDVGKHFTVNAMLAKDSVKRRLESEGGMSYTEFSYSLLQAYDFVQLYDRCGCTLQMGGSDQWGNITAGMELIRRSRGAKAHGLVLPLITNASGAKFGKTEAGTIWLDSALTTPYEFYQFWLNVDDRDAVRYLRFFTLLTREQIDEIDRVSQRQPERRHAQRELAREVTRRVHGDDAVRDAERAAEKLFSGDVSAMSESELLQVFSSAPSSEAPYAQEGWPIAEFLTANNVTSSRGEATRLIRGGGISINARRVTDEKARLTPDQAISGQYFVVRKGKKENFLVRVIRG